MKRENIKSISIIIFVLAILQILLFCIKQCTFLFVTRTNYTDSLSTMFAMVLLTICYIIVAKKYNLKFSFFPKKFNKKYIILTILVLGIFIATPSNYTGEIQPIVLLIYGSIVTPVFEELIFRGYIWNKLNTIFSKEWKTYIVVTILFALWHLGYVDSVAFRINDGIVNAMIWKVITGFCFGVVLGCVRLKTKNCYSTMLLHGIMNVFGR